jgi:hypothetical protein
MVDKPNTCRLEIQNRLSSSLEDTGAKAGRVIGGLLGGFGGAVLGAPLEILSPATAFLGAGTGAALSYSGVPKLIYNNSSDVPQILVDLAGGTRKPAVNTNGAEALIGAAGGALIGSVLPIAATTIAGGTGGAWAGEKAGGLFGNVVGNGLGYVIAAMDCPSHEAPAKTPTSKSAVPTKGGRTNNP